MKNTYRISPSIKLRQFAFKLLHRILVTKKELKRFRLALDDNCVECNQPDSLEHSFLECNSSLRLYQETVQWFNVWHNTSFKPSEQQILLNTNICHPGPNVSDQIKNKFYFLLSLYVKQYIYTTKTSQK